MTLIDRNDPLPFVEGLRRSIHNGIQITHLYSNGYGYSVVRHDGSYGHHHGKFELAVIHKTYGDINWELCYRTPITNDVIGFLDEAAIVDLAVNISQLMPDEMCRHQLEYAD